MAITWKQVAKFIVAASLVQVAVMWVISRDEAARGLQDYIANHKDIVAQTGPNPNVEVNKTTYLEGNPENPDSPMKRNYRAVATGTKGSVIASAHATKAKTAEHWEYGLDELK